MIMTWMMDIGVTQQEPWVWYVGAVVCSCPGQAPVISQKLSFIDKTLGRLAAGCLSPGR